MKMHSMNDIWPRIGKLSAPLDQSGLARVIKGVLETILHLPWLATNAGGVFIAHPQKGYLELVTQINFTPFIAGTCSRVQYGHCLCGRVAQSGKLLHVDCVDERHETRYEGMSNHGHYVVPIKWENELLGVLVLYVEVHHQFNEDEGKVLEDFASLIAQLIQSWRVRQDMAIADMILLHSNHGIIVTDSELKIQWANQAFKKISGYSQEEILDQTPGVLSSGRHNVQFYKAMWKQIDEQGFWEGEIWNRRKDGKVCPHWANIIALKDQKGKVLRYAALYMDLSAIKAAQEKIHQLAFYDEITGLPNINYLREKLDKLLAADGNRGDVAILVFSLNHFQEINASLGRHAGDAVLREVANRIRGILPQCLIARVGTDEFAVVLHHLPGNSADIEASAWQLVHCLQNRLRPHFEYAFQELDLVSTIGLAWGRNDELDPESLLKRATLALSACKARKGIDCLAYDIDLGRKIEHRHVLANSIVQALKQREFSLVYQPQVDNDGEMVGAEVLLRWENQTYGMIPPDFFVPLAEERGYIIEIGSWVFEETLRQIRKWREAGVFRDQRFPKFAINLSPLQLMSRHVVTSIIEACDYCKELPDALELEVTESSMEHHFESVSEHMRLLAERGFKLALDDFGTGHSSLARLHQFPVDILKIDRSFVTNMSQGSAHVALVKSIVDMAHALGLQVVAEGVENQKQYDILLKLGCDFFQGYFFSKPLGGDEFIAWAKRGSEVFQSQFLLKSMDG